MVCVETFLAQEWPMALEQILLLSLIQGLTEFLPVSSSGHLALMPLLCGWQDQGMEMDVAAHMGTLVSVMIYFYKDITRLFLGFFDTLKGRHTNDRSLFWNLVIATVPAVIVGVLFEMYVGSSLRNLYVISLVGIAFALLMYVADRWSIQRYKVTQTQWPQALFFGVSQCFALINGASRSGVCMTAGRFMGYTRVEAARFAFLMSIPTIFGAGLVKGYKLMKMGDVTFLQDALLMAGFSFVAGFFAIAFMMRWLRSSTLTPFVIYRVVLGAILIVMGYTGIVETCAQ